MIITPGETSRNVTSHPQRLPAPPQPASPAAAGAPRGCSWTEACAGESPRVAPCAPQDIGGAGPRPGVSGWRGWSGAPGLDPPASTMWRGKKGEQRPCVWINEKNVKYSCYHVNCTDNSKFKVRRVKHKGRHFNIIWVWVIFLPIFHSR